MFVFGNSARTTFLLVLLLLSLVFAVPAVAFQSNLLQNSNVEVASSNPSLPASWTPYLDSGTATQTWDTGRYVSSSHSVKTVMSSNGVVDWRQLVTGIDSSIKYRFRIHVYASNVTSGSHNVELQWFTSADAYISTTSISSSSANAWSELKLESITPPANAAKVWVLLRTYQPGTYCFDDMVLKRVDNDIQLVGGKFPIGLWDFPDLNMLKNSTLEVRGNGDFPVYWDRVVASGTVTQTWNSSSHYIQTVMGSDGVADWRTFVLSVNPNERYNFSASVYATNVSSGSHAVELQWFTSNNQYISSTTYSAPTANTWCDLIGSNIAPPSNAAKVYVLLRTYKTGTYRFDYIYFRISKTVSQRYAELSNAGFNHLNYCYGFTPGTLDDVADNGLKANYVLGGLMDGTYNTDLALTVGYVDQHSAVMGWLGPDEPAWQNPPYDVNGLISGYNVILANDAYYTSAQHKVVFNHAPRGTQASPNDFTTLVPYNAAADIITMDVYPVPEGNGNSNLTCQTMDCLGDYVDVLYNQVVSSGGIQRKPIWMVLQGFGWGDLLLPETPDPHTYDAHGVELHWFNGNTFLRADVYSAQEANIWYQISFSGITPPANATKVSIVLRGYIPGTYFFDDITLVPQGGQNLVVNGNFETQDGSTGYPANWSRTDSTQSWGTTHYVSSSHSAKTAMSVCGVKQWVQDVNVDPSKTYTLGAWVYATETKDPRPTFNQLRYMTYDSIIHGARGVQYWGTYYVPMVSTLWEDLKDMSTELNYLSPVLISPLSFRSVSASSGSIETLLFSYGSDEYLLAANNTGTAASNVTLTISGLPLTSAKEYIDNSSRTITSNSISDSFDGYQVRVYRLQP